MSFKVSAQYPYQYGFDTDEEGWTITDPGSDDGWESPGYLCFNRTGNYIDGGLHQMTSPVEDHTGVDSIRVTFRVLHNVRVGGAVDRVRFCWNDGGWNSILVGSGTWFVDLPNTTSQVRIELEALGNGSLNGKYVHLDWVTIDQWVGGVLPVELVTWGGQSYEDKVVLHWVTATEINNDRFEVYWSENTNDWTLIDTKQGAGNSSTFIEYHSVHTTNSEYNYYKLKQIDFDGKSKEFNIIVVYISNEFTNKQKKYMYVNPLGQEVNENYKGFKIKLEVY